MPDLPEDSCALCCAAIDRRSMGWKPDIDTSSHFTGACIVCGIPVCHEPPCCDLGEKFMGYQFSMDFKLYYAVCRLCNLDFGLTRLSSTAELHTACLQGLNRGGPAPFRGSGSQELLQQFPLNQLFSRHWPDVTLGLRPPPCWRVELPPPIRRRPASLDDLMAEEPPKIEAALKLAIASPPTDPGQMRQIAHLTGRSDRALVALAREALRRLSPQTPGVVETLLEEMAAPPAPLSAAPGIVEWMVQSEVPLDRWLDAFRGALLGQSGLATECRDPLLTALARHGIQEAAVRALLGKTDAAAAALVALLLPQVRPLPVPIALELLGHSNAVLRFGALETLSSAPRTPESLERLTARLGEETEGALIVRLLELLELSDGIVAELVSPLAKLLAHSWPPAAQRAAELLHRLEGTTPGSTLGEVLASPGHPAELDVLLALRNVSIDRSWIPRLIDRLASEDPLVRDAAVALLPGEVLEDPALREGVRAILRAGDVAMADDAVWEGPALHFHLSRLLISAQPEVRRAARIGECLEFARKR